MDLWDNVDFMEFPYGILPTETNDISDVSGFLDGFDTSDGFVSDV